MINKMPGHEFLAKLGKRRLRPGGKSGTNFLIKNAKKLLENKANIEVLEVSCNRGYSLINIYKKIKPAKVIGIDISKQAIEKAKENVAKNKLEDYIFPIMMNAFNLDFDRKFDLIVNEAMLTMYEDKTRLLNEYKKHLSRDGYLLTHDICITSNQEWENDMKDVINLKPYPLTEKEWEKTFSDCGLEIIKKEIFDFTLVKPSGLLRDEGLFRTIKIIINGNKKENKTDFRMMRKYFKKNKKYLKAICFITKIKG